VQIGNLDIVNPLFLAPMAGITDHPFRILCREMGAGVVFTEFVSANGIIRENMKTLELMKFTENERPIGIQLFGETPDIVGNSAKMVYDMLKPDIIDINYGCPVPKVTKKGAGSAALKDLCLMDDITSAVVEAAGDTPVTVKMRAGWDKNSIVATEVGPRLAKLGIKAVTLHPRTSKMGYKGRADWSLIRELKQSLIGAANNSSIPVIGNGDIRKPEDVLRMFEETGCDGVMVGRAALGNPWFFQQTKALLEGKTTVNTQTISERIKMCGRHFDLLTQDRGERVGTNLMRKHFGWYIKGFQGAATIRRKLVTAPGLKEMKKALHDLRNIQI